MGSTSLFVLFALMVAGGTALVLLYEPEPVPDVVDVGHVGAAPEGEAAGPRHCLARALGYPCPDEPSAPDGNPP